MNLGEAPASVPVGPPDGVPRIDGPVGFLELYWFRPMSDLRPRLIMRPWTRARDGWLLFWIAVGTVAAILVHFLAISAPSTPVEPISSPEPNGPVGTWRQHDIFTAKRWSFYLVLADSGRYEYRRETREEGDLDWSSHRYTGSWVEHTDEDGTVWISLHPDDGPLVESSRNSFGVMAYVVQGDEMVPHPEYAEESTVRFIREVEED